MTRTWLSGGSVELLINASPEEVYDAIADVTAVAGRSLECCRCDWLPGSTPGAAGARFRGPIRAQVVARWSRVCEVTVAEPGNAFAFRTLPEDQVRGDLAAPIHRARDPNHRTAFRRDVPRADARP